MCDLGFFGSSCQQCASCNPAGGSCVGNGTKTGTGVCECAPNYSGLDCSIYTAPASNDAAAAAATAATAAGASVGVIVVVIVVALWWFGGVSGVGKAVALLVSGGGGGTSGGASERVSILRAGTVPTRAAAISTSQAASRFAPLAV